MKLFVRFCSHGYVPGGFCYAAEGWQCYLGGTT